jgi:hypothetical protein
MLTKATTKKKEKSESEDVEKAASVLGKASSSLESSVEKAFVAAVEKKGIVRSSSSIHRNPGAGRLNPL